MRIINSDIGNIHITQDGVYCNKQKLEYIDEGAESIVYKYEDKAIKLYRKQPRKRVLSEEMIYKLKEIPTKRIVMPEGCLYEKNNVKGIYMPYITGNREEVYELEKEKLIEEFQFIYDDLSLLGKERIVIDDLRISNFLCNKDAFYLIDTGDYYISRNIKDTTVFSYSNIVSKYSLSIKNTSYGRRSHARHHSCHIFSKISKSKVKAQRTKASCRSYAISCRF